jgi:hypothetical protein
MTMTTPLRSALFRRIALLIPLTAVTFTGCAHSTSAPDSIPAKEAAAMTAPESTSTTDNPTLSAEEIGKMFLKLIESLGSREDLSLERVKETTGLSLLQASGKSYYGYGQKLTEGWFYAFWFYPEEHGGKRGIRLDFEYEGNSSSSMKAVCALDFDHYHDALKAMGFVDNPTYGEIGQLEYWRYTKFKKSDGAADMTITIIPQNVVAGEAGRLCVKSIHAELN